MSDDEQQNSKDHLEATMVDELLAMQRSNFESLHLAMDELPEAIPSNAARLKVRLSHAESLWAECRQVHVRLSIIATNATRSDPYFTDREFYKEERNYLEFLGTMEEYSSFWTTTRSTSQPAAVNLSTGPRLDARATNHLPRIDLPKFAGEYNNWDSFSDYFRSIIMNDTSIDNIRKFHYLKSCLEGDPRSFDLDERYIIDTHLHALFALPIIRNESVNELRELYHKGISILGALTSLGEPVEHWNLILVHLFNSRLDSESRKAWATSLGSRTIYPTFNEFKQFLKDRLLALQSTTSNNARTIATNLKVSSKTTQKSKTPVQSHATTAARNVYLYPSCSYDHPLFTCKRFKGLPVAKRVEFVKSRQLCTNCLRSHSLTNCQSKSVCFVCSQKHYTLLHGGQLSERDSKSNINSATSPPTSSNNATATHQDVVFTYFSLSQSIRAACILLATATVRVRSTNGRILQVRALLDQGSTWNFLSESLSNALCTRTHHVSAAISGIGGIAAGSATRAADVHILPMHSDEPCLQTRALVMKQLTSYVPTLTNSASQWPHLTNLSLADKDPSNQDPIQLIIGSDLYGSILLDGLVKGDLGQPTAQNTIFGWILSGWTECPKPIIPSSVPVHLSINSGSLSSALQKFWEIEESPMLHLLTVEDEQCERHFLDTHSRDATGRYVVRLPFRHPSNVKFGESRKMALNAFKSTERRLSRQLEDAQAYRDFMHEYESLGHMTLITREQSSLPIVYLPHHGIKKGTSTTTKLRVVFNASHKTSNAMSLNDQLLTGPTLQADLINVILQWRAFQFVYCADIAQMYRQILVDPRDRDIQRILWRTSQEDPIRDYRLNTLTFGVSCAPYLALRVLRQIVVDHGAQYPLASQVILNGSYVDDCLFGADTLFHAREIRHQLISLLKEGRFELRKWASNSPELLNEIDPSNHGLAWEKPLQIDDGIKVLGIVWNPNRDVWRYTISLTQPQQLTKRTLLSVIARLYDPLRWVSPVIIISKILIQRLWLLKLDWDSPLPEDICVEWQKFYSSLLLLDKFEIPRWTGQLGDMPSCELHAFADASSVAYATVIYIRVPSSATSFTVSLLLSRTKVAPLKQLSIPRLELSAALLLAWSLENVRKIHTFSTLSVYCWSDSTITLHWIHQEPTRWKTFIANRVSEIQTLLPDVQWRHVLGSENPADLASRGLSTQELLDNSLWIRGPPWLSKDQNAWPSHVPELAEDAPLETRVEVLITTTCPNELLLSLMERVSSWVRFTRVVALLRRWLQRLRARETSLSPVCSATYLSAAEIRLAKLTIFQWLQAECFSAELTRLHNGLPVDPKSSLGSLHPFIDDMGLIRVGGRLKHSDLPTSTKHPIALTSHPVVKLLVKDTHLRCLHGGVRVTLRTLRQTVWIVQATKIIRSVIYHCMTCARLKAEFSTQLLGNLPNARVSRPERPFMHSGVDYAGPFSVRIASGRGRTAHSAYIALFVCFAVKAVHLELVSDYSSVAFIAAFKRFTARRGIPNCMYSDQGKTFVGANTELPKAFQAAIRDSNFHDLLSKDGTTWKFIPPASPHFGGLWEAGVKSTKFHLKRVLGEHTPIFEEFTSLLCEIEASLNSRPLGPLTNEIDDFATLTPGHFLIGCPLNAIPEESLLEVPLNRLSRWQLYRQLFERFWRLWSSDYLLSLQQRSKWRLERDPIPVGQLVLVKLPNFPPGKWPLARIIECHPGTDGVSRVFTVRTKNSILKRPITQLALLPLQIETEQESVSK